MNTIIFQTIRAGVIAGVVFFAFAESAFAAPVLLPTSVTNITDTSAVIKDYLQNESEITVVWFEWSEASSSAAPTVVGMDNFFGSGFFGVSLRELSPNTVYSYRAAVRRGGATIYSPTMSFKTLGNGSGGSSASSGALGLGSMISSPAPTTVVVQTPAQTKVETPVVKVKSTPTPKADGFTNGNAAAEIGVGNGIFPTTLIGWILLLIAILVAVLVADMIYRSFEKRSNAHHEEEKK